MKATYKLMIVCAKVEYPAGMGRMPDHIWEQFIDGLTKQDNKPVVTIQSDDYDKVYMSFKRINVIEDNVKIDNRLFIRTQAYYFIQCKYIGNKLVEHQIHYKKHPKQYIRSIT